MLADSFLPNTIWVEAVSTASYVLIGPFGCHVTILNTIDHLGKFEEKSDEGFLVGYSLSSKAFRLNEDTDSKINEEPVDQENQAFFEELARLKRQEKEANDAAETLKKTFAQSTKDLLLQAGAARASSTNDVNTARTPVNTASTPLNIASTSTNQDDSQIPSLEDIYEVSRDGNFTSASYNDDGAVADFTNLETTVNVYRNKKDERGVVVRNKARLVSQGYRKEEGIEYDEVFALVARIEAIRIFLAFASYIGFIVYQMDVKSAFLYGKINEEVYVSYPPGFIDPKFPNKIYIDNEITICIVKNPVFHSKIKHIEIRHHFIRDAYEKKLIHVLKIHTDDNVANLLTKAFDVNSADSG
nr:retrovirus-related Pol polyprotein from transposon TNT 1-94 [Tanacetum cinerariifolium]